MLLLTTWMRLWLCITTLFGSEARKESAWLRRRLKRRETGRKGASNSSWKCHWDLAQAWLINPHAKSYEIFPSRTFKTLHLVAHIKSKKEKTFPIQFRCRWQTEEKEKEKVTTRRKIEIWYASCDENFRPLENRLSRFSLNKPYDEEWEGSWKKIDRKRSKVKQQQNHVWQVKLSCLFKQSENTSLYFFNSRAKLLFLVALAKRKEKENNGKLLFRKEQSVLHNHWNLNVKTGLRRRNRGKG